MQGDLTLRIRRELQQLIQECVKKMFPGKHLFVPLPMLFGSRAYKLPSDKSDVDILLLAPADVSARSNDLRILLADRLMMRHPEVDQKTVRNQKDNFTLKWKDPITELSCSVTINLPSELYNQLHTTHFLHYFYAHHESYRDVVQRVIKKLRDAEVLNLSLIHI